MSGAKPGDGRRFTAEELLEEERRVRAEASFLEDREQVLRLLPATQYAMADLSPQDWTRVARFLHAILMRDAIASSPWWEPLRLLVGALVTELYTAARERGEPMPDLSRAELEEWRKKVDRILAGDRA